MKKHLLFVPILASLVLAGCGEQPTPPGPTPDPDPVVVNPTGITLSASSLSLIEGESETITATVSPDDAADKTVTWSVTQGSEYVTVNGGVITAVKAGQAVITAKTVNNLATSCFVNVTPAIVDPKSVTVSKKDLVIVVGDTEQLTATVLPENATNKSVEWSVVAGNCITVDATGLVTASAEGTAVVEVKTINDERDYCNVKVVSAVINPTSVALSDSQVNIVNGDAKQLSAHILPNDATDKTLIWAVSEGDAVTVSNSGLVKAVKPGDAVVTVSTVNGLTATCSFTVTAAVVDPTGVTLNKHSVDLEFGSSEKLTAKVDPSDATDKSVTWSVIEGDAVTVINGLVTGVKQGSAKVQVSTINGKTDVCDFTVGARHIKGYVNKDVHSLIVGNPYEKIGDGDFVEVTDKTTEGGVPCYNFTYGATVKFNVHTDGYYEPTAIKVNNDSYSVVDNAVTFVAEVEDPDDPIFNILDIEVVFRDNTPLIGDYEIVTTESTHISLKYTYAVNGQETKACSSGDLIIITPVSSDQNYEVKAITGYTYQTDDIIKQPFKITFKKLDNGDYSFTCPYSSPSCSTIYIAVEEVNSTLFKNHELVGDYLVLRTYGIAGNGISDFTKGMMLSFRASGEIEYGSTNDPSEKHSFAYASSATDGILTGLCGKSSFEGYYSNNILVLGAGNLVDDKTTFVTPLEKGNGDIIICVKIIAGLDLSKVTLDNNIVKVNGNSYGIFNFYNNGILFASCYADFSNESLETGTKTVHYQGTTIHENKMVFEVFDKDNNSLLHFGYIGDGLSDDYRLIISRKNGYSDSNHSLVFINDNEAVFDGVTYSVAGLENDIVLSCPTYQYYITLNPTSMTYVITDEKAIVPKTLDIANKVFVGKSGADWDGEIYDITITFGNSNDNITGVLLMNDNVKRYWAFDAEFDPLTDILLITVTDRGYGGQPSDIDSSIGKQARIKVEDRKLTIMDHISTQTNVYNFKNCVVTCDDFHF